MSQSASAAKSQNVVITLFTRLLLLLGMFIVVGLLFTLPSPFDLISGVGVIVLYVVSALYIGNLINGKAKLLIQQGKFRETIAHYEGVYDFFARHPRLDNRSLLAFFAPSPISARETALLGIAYCYGQLGDGEQAKATYERTLREFPNSAAAQSALNLIHSVEKAD